MKLNYKHTLPQQLILGSVLAYWSVVAMFTGINSNDREPREGLS